ncbi:MAG: DNA alkylation repair protein [Lachnospiraceae bacterium]|nr:DNA alkylation repair protein [Lachnospiraceae bacterium]
MANTENKLTQEIRNELFGMQDLKYRELQTGIIPSRDPQTLIGVRTPALRSFAKQLAKREDLSDFLNDLPHLYFDEDQLHAFIISEIKDYDTCMAELEKFLPHVDNWATCDQMSPKVFKKHKEELLVKIREWIASDRPYTVRFGIGMLMQHFLDEDFDPAYPELAAGIRSEEYYVKMMIAWYFATALAKQYEAVLPYIENQRLDVWTHNKAIQKAIESYRITPEQKEYLRTLKIRRDGRV